MSNTLTRVRTEVLGKGAVLETTEHRSGRVDVSIMPAPAEFEAITHRTGKKRGDVAELRVKGTRREVDTAGLTAVMGGGENLHTLAKLAQLQALEDRGRRVRLADFLDRCRNDERGAITASGYYGLTLEKQLIDTAALSMESETAVKVLMVEDGYTPNFDTHDFRNDLTNEVVGTGYSPGGSTLTSTELTLAAGLMTYDAADVSWAASTIPNAMAAVGYFNVGTSATDMLLWLSDFVTAASSTAGTFTIQWNASGIITIDYTP